ncbi:MAG: DivIVA domain-containing protein [Deltaproteobacteria bacterium]
MITSAEIRDKKFKTSLIGYSFKDVDSFVSAVAEEFERLTTEGLNLSEEVRGLTADLELYKRREESIIKTMMSSQKVCDDMKRNAEKESHIILSEAALNAEKMIAAAQEKLTGIEGEIAEMRRQKIRFGEALRSLLTTHFKLMDISKDEPVKG